MRRIKSITAALACLFLLACAAPAALAAPSENEADIGKLSSRYSTLNDLANSHNPDESVVVDTRIAVLVSANRALDDSTVRFEGEVCGEPISAGDGDVWVSVNNSSGGAVQVKLTQEQASKIKLYGDYKQDGDVIRVTGAYHVACSEHEGALDVHADSIEIEDEGEATEHPVSKKRLVVACALVAFGLVLLGLFALLRWLDRRKGSKGKRKHGRKR